MKVQESSEQSKNGSSPSRRLQFGNNDPLNLLFPQSFQQNEEEETLGFGSENERDNPNISATFSNHFRLVYSRT